MNWAMWPSLLVCGENQRYTQTICSTNWRNIIIDDMFAGRPLTTHIPPLQHQPDLDQEEQQHVHPLWRDGFLADERHSCQSSDRCLKYELRYLMTCDLATYLLNIGARLRWPPNRVQAMHTADKKLSALSGLQIFRERPNLATEDAQFEWIS